MNISLKNTAKKPSTLLDLLNTIGNDYSSLEDKYLYKYHQYLLSNEPVNEKIKFSSKVSIIIPSYNSTDTVSGTLATISNQLLSDSERSLLEVLVIDDGSTDDTEITIQQQKYNFDFKYIKQTNQGRSIARNNGVGVSTGEILIFLDSDVLLEKNFIREHVLRCEALDHCVFISFKENIYLDKTDIISFIKKGSKPNIEKDFRFSKVISPEWRRIHRSDIPIETRVVKVITESNDLKDFGRGKVLGVWDLPSIALTCSISMRKYEFLKSGGFSPRFKGWGMEDTYLGARLISDGNYFIPVYSTGVFHIKHVYRSGSEENQIREFNDNVKIYNKLLEQRIDELTPNQGMTN